MSVDPQHLHESWARATEVVQQVRAQGAKPGCLSPVSGTLTVERELAPARCSLTSILKLWGARGHSCTCTQFKIVFKKEIEG